MNKTLLVCALAASALLHAQHVTLAPERRISRNERGMGTKLETVGEIRTTAIESGLFIPSDNATWMGNVSQTRHFLEYRYLRKIGNGM